MAIQDRTTTSNMDKDQYEKDVAMGSEILETAMIMAEESEKRMLDEMIERAKKRNQKK